MPAMCELKAEQPEFSVRQNLAVREHGGPYEMQEAANMGKWSRIYHNLPSFLTKRRPDSTDESQPVESPAAPSEPSEEMKSLGNVLMMSSSVLSQNGSPAAEVSRQAQTLIPCDSARTLPRMVATPAATASDAPKLLVVEDEAIVALDLIVTLKHCGYGVSGHVVSGEEAIEEAEKTRPDLVLMDIRLSGPMNGIEAAERIHSRFGIPVIFLTAFSDDDTLSRMRILKMAGYLPKPFSKTQLRDTIAAVLAKHAANGS